MTGVSWKTAASAALLVVLLVHTATAFDTDSELSTSGSRSASADDEYDSGYSSDSGLSTSGVNDPESRKGSKGLDDSMESIPEYMPYHQEDQESYSRSSSPGSDVFVTPKEHEDSPEHVAEPAAAGKADGDDEAPGGPKADGDAEEPTGAKGDGDAEEPAGPKEDGDDKPDEEPVDPKAPEDPSKWNKIKKWFVDTAKDKGPKLLKQYGPVYGPLIGAKILGALKGKLPEALQGAADAGIKALEKMSEDAKKKDEEPKKDGAAEEPKKDGAPAPAKPDVERAVKSHLSELQKELDEFVDSLFFVGEGAKLEAIPELSFKAVAKVASKIMGRGVNKYRPVEDTIGDYSAIVEFPSGRHQLKPWVSSGVLKFDTSTRGTCSPTTEFFASDTAVSAKFGVSAGGLVAKLVSPLIDASATFGVSYSKMASSRSLYARCRCTAQSGHLLFQPTGEWRTLACGAVFRMWRQLPPVGSDGKFSCDGLSAWFQFFNWYGTHFIRAATLGGLVEVGATVDASASGWSLGVDAAAKLKESMTEAVSIDLNISAKKSKSSKEFSATFTHRVEGGDPAKSPVQANSASTQMPQVDRGRYAEWVATLQSNMYPIETETGPIYQVLEPEESQNRMSDPEAARHGDMIRTSYDTAIEAYKAFSALVLSSRQTQTALSRDIQEWKDNVSELSAASYDAFKFAHEHSSLRQRCTTMCSLQDAERRTLVKIFENDASMVASPDFQACMADCDSMIGSVQFIKDFPHRVRLPEPEAARVSSAAGLRGATPAWKKSFENVKVEKLTHGIVRRWQNRVLSLTSDGSLTYSHYKASKGDERTIVVSEITPIPLWHIVGVAELDMKHLPARFADDHMFGFSIDTVDTSYIFRVSSKATVDMIIEAVNSWRSDFSGDYQKLTRLPLVEEVVQQLNLTPNLSNTAGPLQCRANGRLEDLQAMIESEMPLVLEDVTVKRKAAEDAGFCVMPVRHKKDPEDHPRATPSRDDSEADESSFGASDYASAEDRGNGA